MIQGCMARSASPAMLVCAHLAAAGRGLYPAVPFGPRLIRAGSPSSVRGGKW